MSNHRRFGGKNVRDPNFHLNAIQNERNQLSQENANQEKELVKKDIIIEQLRKQLAAETSRKSQQLITAQNGKRKANKVLKTTKLKKTKVANENEIFRGLRGSVKIPQRPVAILIGNDCESHGRKSIYGARDMENLSMKLQEWMPLLEEDGRILLLRNGSTEEVHRKLWQFVSNQEIFPEADFIFIATSTHGAEHPDHINGAGHKCSAIEDGVGGMMLFQGSKNKPGIIDVVEYFANDNAKRFYFHGACRTPFNDKDVQLTIPMCHAFNDHNNICQSNEKPGYAIEYPCTYKKSAYAADPNDNFSPWLQAFVNNMDQPGRKFLEAIKATEADMWIKTYGKETEQLSTLKDNGGFFYVDKGTNKKFDIIFQHSIVDKLQNQHSSSSTAVAATASISPNDLNVHMVSVDNDNNDTYNEIATNENDIEIDFDILNEFDVDSLNFDELLSGRVYEGEKKNGKPHGKGKMTYVEGHEYDGDWEDGKMHGKGKATNDNGIVVYDGDWKDGNKHGKGTYTWGSGSVYDGEFKDGKPHGKGTRTFANGNVYDGDWKDGNMHGNGKMTYASGNVYVGEWKDDKKHGKGTYTYASGSVYDGDYKDDKRNGKGTYTYASGSVYVGEWKDNNRDGKCTYTFANGDVYVGEYKDDKINGYGKYTKADGSIYHDGMWKDDKRVRK